MKDEKVEIKEGPSVKEVEYKKWEDVQFDDIFQAKQKQEEEEKKESEHVN